MVVRLDHAQAVAADMHTWYWEAEDKIYKKPETFYDKMVEVHPISEIQGGYFQGTTAIGVNRLQPRDDYGKAQEIRPLDGYTIYASIKSQAAKMKVPYEVSRDMVKTKDYLRDYVQKNVPGMFLNTKELLVAEMYNKGGYTSGDASFNQNNADMGLSSTYTDPLLMYDGEPIFNLSNNTRAAKDASTYYNALALTGVNYENALSMYLLLTSTNAYREDGSPFDNSQDIIVVCNPALAPDWKIVNNSTLNPDNAQNAANPLQGMIKDIVANPYLTTTTMSVMQRRALGIKFFCSDPIMNYWEEKDPLSKWFSIGLDYAACLWNFRPLVANNAPTA